MVSQCLGVEIPGKQIDETWLLDFARSSAQPEILLLVGQRYAVHFSLKVSP